jgi:orotate phosphoribosyltransferase
MTAARMAVQLGLMKFAPAGQPFPGRSGASAKPYVLDTRGAGSHLQLRELILEELLKQAQALPRFEVFGGISKSGTVWGAWCALRENMPFANILLDGARASGLQRDVEGDVAGRHILLVDNWIHSGDSIIKATEVVRRAGAVPVAALGVARHGDVSLPIPVASAWTITELLDAARIEGLWSPTGLPTTSPTSNKEIT